MASNEEDKCHLLALPAEIRLRIYEYVYDEEIAVDITETCEAIDREETPVMYENEIIEVVDQYYMAKKCRAALVKTCKTINDEAVPFIYSQFRSQVHFDYSPLGWPIRVGRPNTPLKHVKHVQLLFEELGRHSLREYVNIVSRLCEELEAEAFKTCAVERKYSLFDSDFYLSDDEDYNEELKKKVVKEKEAFEREAVRLAVDLNSETASAKVFRSIIEYLESEIKDCDLQLQQRIGG